MFHHAAPDILYFCWITIVAKKTALYFLRSCCYCRKQMMVADSLWLC